MIELQTGNLLTSPAEALVNTVNTEGVMGKGIALQFRQAFPPMYRAYEAACQRGDVQLGKMDVHDMGGLLGGPRWIINFPTKGHWRAKSRLADVDSGLADLVRVVRELGIQSIALPPLGCGNGGLDWKVVRPRIESAFAALPEVKVLLYAPVGAPEAAAMPNRTKKTKMTAGQATLVMLMDRYLKGMLDPFVSLLEVHKLMYFLKAAGEPLPRLTFEKGTYGPYSKDLRHGLIRMEGHLTRGYGAGSDNPQTPLELLPGAVDSAKEFLSGSEETRSRMDRVAALIEGFEDTHGMELLSSVHWVMVNEPGAAANPQAAIAAVRGWSERKKELLKAEPLQKAWRRLKEQGWA
ncbi:MAG: macro domain-containing protein [Prosthecobacter sp.]|jgi:O-acetyl-ADP-ribose deacetylase (regulator of RNase III)|uniref:type II toxin-antitoxin system antitoxin DNA ADP-ribosyl glycohydrolase DarG n=1 Tax=Prosthecobacter sp. TaxID=1965333 RepID=UPI0019F7E233|nr:macro domain-containing protein [Prosthecobacter sp.]MBE2281905.1 macro domain-containing protein [Prosthecobacter sp.]